jgi:hypothetical protein
LRERDPDRQGQKQGDGENEDDVQCKTSPEEDVLIDEYIGTRNPATIIATL